MQPQSLCAFLTDTLKSTNFWRQKPRKILSGTSKTFSTVLERGNSGRVDRRRDEKRDCSFHIYAHTQTEGVPRTRALQEIMTFLCRLLRSRPSQGDGRPRDTPASPPPRDAPRGRGRGTPRQAFDSGGCTWHPGSPSAPRYRATRCPTGQRGRAGEPGRCSSPGRSRHRRCPCSPAAARCHLLLAFRVSCPLLPITATAARSVATSPGRSQSGKIPRQHTRRLPTALRLPLPRRPRAPLRAPAAACMLISATSGSPPHARVGSAAARRLGNRDIQGCAFFPSLFSDAAPVQDRGVRISNSSFAPKRGGDSPLAAASAASFPSHSPASSAEPRLGRPQHRWGARRLASRGRRRDNLC